MPKSKEVRVFNCTVDVAAQFLCVAGDDTEVDVAANYDAILDALEARIRRLRDERDCEALGVSDIQEDCYDDCDNQFGLFCPRCAHSDGLSVEAQIVVDLMSDGTEDAGGNHQWDDDSKCRCSNCLWTGVVKELLRVPELEND